MLNSPDVNSERRLAAAAGIVRKALLNGGQDLTAEAFELRVQTILADVVLLARCGRSKCLITYTDAIALRGHGNRQNGRWLDEVYAYAIAPLGFPDLTMLVVTKTTKLPSPDAFEARRSILSKIHINDTGAEQRRCVWFSGYEEVLGPLDPIPPARMAARLLAPQPAKEREISRAVGNAIGRVTQAGLEKITIGREYPESLPRAELVALVGALWDRQNGRCALTGQAFELRSDEEGGVQDDRVSLDRIDNLVGYTETNVQLVTQFANRARGVLPVEEARRRLVQFDH